MAGRKQEDNICKVLKEVNVFKNLISSKVIFQKWGEMKTLPDKQKLGEFVASRPVLQEIL